MPAAFDAAPDLVHEWRGLDEAQLMAALGAPGQRAEGRFYPDSYRYAAGTPDATLGAYEDTMSEITDELKHDFKSALESLQTLRDEVRVKMHLASMDAKDQWSKLEVDLDDAQRDAENVTHDTRVKVAAIWAAAAGSLLGGAYTIKQFFGGGPPPGMGPQ